MSDLYQRSSFEEEIAKVIDDHLASLEEKIKNEKRIIDKLEWSLTKLHKKKQSLNLNKGRYEPEIWS